MRAIVIILLILAMSFTKVGGTVEPKVEYPAVRATAHPPTEQMMSPATTASPANAPAMQVPTELMDAISVVLPKGKEAIYEFMSARVSDRELSEEELTELAECSEDIREAMTETKACDGYGCWVMVDGDNDGIEDVFLQQYLGGSLGIVYYYFFQGTADGGFIGEIVGNCLRQEFAFIEWNGENYLAQTTFDFDKKVYDGIQVTAYTNGLVSDNVWLQLVKAETADARRTEEIFVQEAYREAIADEMLTFPEEYEIDVQSRGSAESQEEIHEEFHWQGDMDNDGESEWYHKSTWYTSNSYTQTQLEFSAEDTELEERFYEAVREDGSRPMLMWVEETEKGNITYLLFEDALYDFHISAYRFTEEGCDKLMQVNHTFELTVKVHEDMEAFEFIY